MDAGLVACSGAADESGVRAKLAEDTVDPAIAQRLPRSGSEERRSVPGRPRPLVPPLGIVPELGRQLWSGGDQPRLAKLGLAYQQQAVLKLDIGQGQVQRFADAYPRTAEH